jgi:hypothetical protein
VPWALETRTLRPDPPPVFPDRHGKRRHEWDGVIGGGAAGERTSRGLVQVSAIDRRYESACTRRPESVVSAEHRPVGHGLCELVARDDVELGENVAQVVGDGALADEQSCADFGVR